MRLLALPLPLMVGVLTGCSGDPQDNYCEAVEEHQVAVTEIAASSDTGSEQTVTAMASVDQHALDVCGTPLSR